MDDRLILTLCDQILLSFKNLSNNLQPSHSKSRLKSMRLETQSKHDQVILNNDLFYYFFILQNLSSINSR